MGTRTNKDLKEVKSEYMQGYADGREEIHNKEIAFLRTVIINAFIVCMVCAILAVFIMLVLRVGFLLF